MTELLYLPSIDDNYIRSFTATVTKAKRDYIILDRTAFYPRGGGQPSDRGTISWDRGNAAVVKVEKKGVITHTLATTDALPEPGTSVRCELDWDRRYRFMRMHSAQHLISGVVYNLYGARTVGNQIGAETSRVDFRPMVADDDALDSIAAACNERIDAAAALAAHLESRDEYERRPEADRLNLDLLPASVTELRVVTIEGVDAIPCAGTHVRSLGELGALTIVRRSSKGRKTVRLTYELAPLPQQS